MNNSNRVSSLQKQIENIKESSPAAYQYFMQRIAEPQKDSLKRTEAKTSKIRPIAKTLSRLTKSAMI